MVYLSSIDFHLPHVEYQVISIVSLFIMVGIGWWTPRIASTLAGYPIWLRSITSSIAPAI